MDGLYIEDKLKGLEEFIGKSFVNRLDNINSTIADNNNYRNSYVSDLNNEESSKIGLDNCWHHLFYNKHTNINGYGMEIAFPLDNTSVTPKWRNANSGSWSSWKNLNDGGNADKLDGYHADSFLLKSGGTMTGTITGTFSGNLSGTVNSLETYKLETLAASGGRHGTAHYMYCKYNVYGDGRFALLMEQGHEIRVHCATNLQGYLPRTVYQDAAYVPLTGNLPLEIGTWIDFHKTSSTADFDGRLYFDTNGGGLCWQDTINPTAYNMNILWEIYNLKQQASNGISNKQAVVNAIDGKLGYASGLTTAHSGADYAWWITNKLTTGYNVTFNSWNQINWTGKTNISGYAMTQFQTKAGYYSYSAASMYVVLQLVSGTVYYMDGGGLTQLTSSHTVTLLSAGKFEVYCEKGAIFSAYLSSGVYDAVWVTQYMQYL